VCAFFFCNDLSGRADEESEGARVEQPILREAAAAVHRCHLLFPAKGPLCTIVRGERFNTFDIGEGG
jgi:hypothetical protein